MTDEQMADESGWRAADHNARTDAAAGLMTLWEAYADEIERLRAVVRTAQESLHQAMERIRFMEATKRSINPVAKSYLEQAERVLAEVLGDE